MDKWMILLAAAACALAGFAWLALAMEAHWSQVFEATPASQATQTALRALGVLGLAATGALCFAADRPSMAILVWILFMAFGAVTTALMLAWKPALLRFVFPGSDFGLRADKHKA